MHFVYILYSKKIDKFYVGETEDVHLRITQHNNHFFKNAFTAQTFDWVLFWKLDCNDISQAKKIENHIKKMKSRTYLHNLKKYPEISQKLLLKYN